MANKKEATLLLKIKTAGENAITGIKDRFSKMISVGSKVVLVLAAIGGSMTKLAVNASKFKEVQNAFNNLAAAQGQDAAEMLNNMKKLSGGTISELELMKKANNALLLGLPVERFGEMLKIARSAAKATGQTMEFQLNSLVVGLGRQSKLMLDNLGIIVSAEKANEKYANALKRSVSSLTDAERKQAFINEALRIGNENAKKSTSSNDTLADSWERFKANVENLAIAIGNQLIPAVAPAIKSFNELTTAAKRFFESDKSRLESQSLKNLKLELIAVQGEMKGIDEQLKKDNSAKKYAFAMKIVNDQVSWFARKIGLEYGQTQDGMINRMKELNKLLPKLHDQIALKNEQLKKGTILQKEQAAAEAEAASKAKALAEQKRIDSEEEKILKEIEREEEKEKERLYEQSLSDIKIQAIAKRLDDEIRLAKTKEEKLKAHKKRELFIENQANMQTVRNEKAKNEKIKQDKSALNQFEKFLNSKRLADQMSTFSRIATLSESNNKALFLIGKAAALAHISIDTARGVTKALGAFPPPLNFALAGAVGAAGAIQASKAAGINMADGGIVQATQGGTMARIGERGQDEAVIPLEDSGGGIGGNTVNITVNGGMLGDESSAREFARAVDKELLSLRRDNESFSFDEGIA
jgi:hypothetical protein